MKKSISILILLILLMITVKYFSSNYDITYDVDDYKIREINKQNTMYYEITYEGVVYSYIVNSSRKLFKKNIKTIKEETIDDKICLTPNDLYTLCSKDNYIINKEDFKYNKETKDFSYTKALNDKEYMLIWKYDGFYYMNGNEYKNINIFKKDRYSNDLMIKVDNYLVFPKYDEDYTFDGMIILNIINGKYTEINSKYNISYDSYYAGTHKHKLYLFDNKNEELYEINYKKGTIKKAVTGHETYFKFEKGKKVKTELSEYKNNKVDFFEKEDEIIIANNNIINYKYNDKVNYKFTDEEDIKVLDIVNNKVYFMYKDNVYALYEGKISLISHYFEFNFNNSKNVFLYSE